jgi:hypothetical protein
MVTQVELGEYLDEIRDEVCSRCVERPPGGPPCEPLGKMCGVELHLENLIDSIHQVRSNRIEPYLDHNRHEICEKCAFVHSSVCPCPMDSLALLVVQAVETVDERRRQRGEAYRATPDAEEVSLEAIRQAYLQAVGSWSGCDWPTAMGKTGLNVNGRNAAQAASMGQEADDPELAEDWYAAGRWLAHVEHYAQLAEIHAAQAVMAAEEGRWHDALTRAEWAWSLEFSTGRPLRHTPPHAWQQLRECIEAAYLAHQIVNDPCDAECSAPS